MDKQELMVTATADALLDLQEFCRVCDISLNDLHDLIAHEIIQPQQVSADQWQFDLGQLTRARRALRIHHDLEVNLAGVVLILELLEEIKILREQDRLITQQHRMMADLFGNNKQD